MSRAAPTQPPRAAAVKPKRTHLELSSGRYLDYLDPRPEDISLDDIATALSNQCRWGGHCPVFYSIAEHACLVHDIIESQSPEALTVCLAALHHDDHEAFVCDLPTPLKNVFGQPYYDIADRLDAVIADVVGVPSAPWFHLMAIRRADALALHLEAEQFKPSKGRTWAGRPPVVELPAGVQWACGLSPADARRAYLDRHAALTLP